ncbi:MAG TPA: hypothetical protein VFR57_04525 [Burkholderiales bacterium]|nr:hypothetical protein [Burkholderiales bacterium]
MRYKLFSLCVAASCLFSGASAAEPFRYRVQPERERAWVIDAKGLFLEEARRPRRSIALADWQWAAEPYACAPDIAIGPRGEAIVTSNVLPVLWKVDPDTLAVSVHRLELDADTDKDVGFSSLVYSARHGAYFAVSEQHASLWRIDPLLRRAQKISAAAPARGACALTIERQERLSRPSTLCLHARGESWLVNLAPDQRSAYVQTVSCSFNPYTVLGGTR